jgi:hypothetical protein
MTAGASTSKAGAMEDPRWDRCIVWCVGNPTTDMEPRTTDHPHSLVHSMAVINYPEMWIVKTIKINSHTHTRTGIARDDALGTQEHPC